MPHTIAIPDELWSAFEGSPMEMRNALYTAQMRRELRVAETEGRAVDKHADDPWGTLFIARKETTCPICEATVHHWDFAVMTDWAKGGRRGSGTAVHARCAEREGIVLRWSPKKLNSDFRYLSNRPGVRRVS